MTVLHTTSVEERCTSDQVAAQARCDCGWEGPLRGLANAMLIAQEDAWDHVERVQAAVNAHRLAPAA